MPFARPETIYLAIDDNSDRRVIVSNNDFTRSDNGPYWVLDDIRVLRIYLVRPAGSTLEYVDPPTGYTYTLRARREDDFAAGADLLEVELTEGRDEHGLPYIGGTLDLTDEALATALDLPDLGAPNAESIRLRNQLRITANDDSEDVRLFFPSLLRPNIDPAA